MELAAMTLYKTVVMAVLALVGVFCYHQKMIDEELNKKTVGSGSDGFHTYSVVYFISDRV